MERSKKTITTTITIVEQKNLPHKSQEITSRHVLRLSNINDKTIESINPEVT
ncbi:MAG: hypothetical protein IH840_12400 [Candidatus Heimdallarchaeota archaeon]|nr:hypothetical protein [Candidatus Heimdallarchaeota archaeon]